MRDREVVKKIEMGETAATITCAEGHLQIITDAIAEARSELIDYIRQHPDFMLTLEPVEFDDEAPGMVKRMMRASSAANVGPMAAVAGAIAGAGVEAAKNAGSKHCIVDNGGDIALLLDRPTTVGILTQLESDLLPTLELPPTKGKIIGLCTSSGIFGHSISFGRAEAATVMATEAELADALATALGNGCKDVPSMKNALESLSKTDGVLWALAIVDGQVGTLGDMPKLLAGRRSPRNVTVHSKFPAKTEE